MIIIAISLSRRKWTGEVNGGEMEREKWEEGREGWTGRTFFSGERLYEKNEIAEEERFGRDFVV